MSDKKTILKKIAELFTLNDEEKNFMDIKVQDNRILRVSDMVIDGSIIEITEEGEIELKDGEYIIEESGVIISVKENKIAEIIEPKEEVEEIEIELEIEEVEVIEDIEISDEMKELFENIKKLISDIATLKEDLTKLQKENELLNTTVTEFSKAPSTTPTKTKMDFKSEKPKSILQLVMDENKKNK
jgi:regulator of replication initiation timing